MRRTVTSRATFPHRATLVLFALLFTTAQSAAAQTYFPGRHPDWERRTPEQAGFDPAGIQRAVEIAIAGESQSPRDLAFNHLGTFGREPLGDAVGPFTVRGPQSGVIVHRGYIIAEWGDPAKADNTFSVSKSFLSSTVGLARDRGLIRDVDDKVRDYIPPIILDTGDGEPGDENGRRPKLLFESEHNRKITWDHSSGRRATGRGRSGASPSGPTAPTRTALPGARARATSPAPPTSTTTRGSTCSPSPPPPSGGAPCPKSCASTSWTRSAPRPPGDGTATTTRGSSWTAARSRRSAAALTGAAE